MQARQNAVLSIVPYDNTSKQEGLAPKEERCGVERGDLSPVRISSCTSPRAQNDIARALSDGCVSELHPHAYTTCDFSDSEPYLELTFAHGATSVDFTIHQVETD